MQWYHQAGKHDARAGTTGSRSEIFFTQMAQQRTRKGRADTPQCPLLLVAHVSRMSFFFCGGCCLNPFSGKSVLLRALSGRLSHDSGLQGSLRYNGLTRAECIARGIHVTRLCSYVGQNDTQFPTLTVEETLEFARNNGVADVNLLHPDEALRAMDQRRTELLMDMLGLTECRGTYIGSDLMRGVSGGSEHT